MRTASLNHGPPRQAKAPPEKWRKRPLHSCPDRKRTKFFVWIRNEDAKQPAHRWSRTGAEPRHREGDKVRLCRWLGQPICPMGSLDPRRCATPQAVAKIDNGTACGRMMVAGRKRSGGDGESSAGHSACGWLERASFRPGWLSGAEAGTARSGLARRKPATSDGARLKRPAAEQRGVAGCPRRMGSAPRSRRGGTFSPVTGVACKSSSLNLYCYAF